ncbi:DNA repair protein RecO [Aliidiomarina sp. Khilg15.8]
MQAAYVLHRWPYQENSFIIELFSQQQGRIRAVAKGARRSKKGQAGLLQPFRQLQVDLVGRGELKTLTTVEAADYTQPLQGDFLYCGFYMNELLQRLLPEQAAIPSLFNDYAHTLQLLRDQVSMQPVLRKFEWLLLRHLELDFSWETEVEHGDPIDAQRTYYFKSSEGFAEVLTEQAPTPYFGGDAILQMAQFELSEPLRLQQFKHIMRCALAPYLGSKPLRSRELFQGQSGPTNRR